MLWRVPFAPGVVLHTTHALARHQVRPGSAEAGRFYRLVYIEHDLVACGQLHRLLVVVHHVLPVVVLPFRVYRPDIARLYSVHAKAVK